MTTEPLDLTVAIPAYMEEENLRVLAPRLVHALEKLDIQWEVLVLDTQTPMDQTAEVCAEYGLTWTPRQNGNSYGDAVRSGIQKSRGNHVLFMDADGSHSPEFISELYRNRGSYDAVIASRYVAGGNTDNSKILIFMSRAVNIVYSLVLGIRCKDISNSFKLYNGELLRSLTLKCSNFDIVEEILVKMRRNRRKQRQPFTWKELPYTFKERMFGHTKRNLMSFIFSYIFTLIRLRFSR